MVAESDQDGYVGDDMAGGTSEDEDAAAERAEAKEKSSKPGMQPLSAEDKVYNSLAVVLDDAHAVEVEVLMAGHTRDAGTLQAHSDDLFQGASKAGYRAKMGHWLMYLKIAYPGQQNVVPLPNVVWPPTLPAWKTFLWSAREQISSYGSFSNAVINVCWLGTRHFSAKTGQGSAQLDPRQLYSQEHLSTMVLIRREYGTAVKQVEAITIHEALNATHFADITSVRGVSQCAAFTMGALMGGRRPRTLTAIRLRDVKLTVGLGEVDGQQVKVPHAVVTFTDEKYMDLQGDRKATDEPYYSGYAAHIWNSPAYWIYRQLVMRGCFDSFDPILTLNVGDEIKVAETCLPYFLFVK